MIPERNNLDTSRHLEALLEAAIVEPILEACASEASIMELTCVTQRLLPTPYNTLKKYLFYLIEYDLVAYRGRKRAYVITYNGLSLLFEIKREKMMVDSDSNDVLISFD
jgi:predicted transcriptional regulator